ncbi:MAG: alpha/beta fold hydrolase [Micromonosporaceae bacterium]
MSLTNSGAVTSGWSPVTAVHRLRPGTPDGPRIVVAHGIEDHWRNWRGLAGHLPTDWRVDALELPWQSGNDYRWRHDGTVGHWLRAALDALDGPVDALVGHSLGATATLELISGGDHRARTAALVCPVYLASPSELTWDFVAAVLPQLIWEFRELVRIRMRGRRRPPAPEIVESMADKVVEGISPVSYLALFDQFLNTAEFPLEAVGVPVMVMAVGNDPGLSPEGAKLLAERIPRAAAYVRDDFDHFCHVHEAETVAELLTRFLTDALR